MSAGLPAPNARSIAALPPTDHVSVEEWRDVYQPTDDTYFFLDTLADFANRFWRWSPTVCLEFGPGSGAITTFLATLLTNPDRESQEGDKAAGWSPFPLLYACDVNAAACDVTRRTFERASVNGTLETICCDLGSPLRTRLRGKVDVILFNPPYVPTPAEEMDSHGIAAAWAGGDNGRVVIDRSLPIIRDFLSDDGECWMMTLAENKPREIAAEASALGLRAFAMRSRLANNERLTVMRFRPAASEAPWHDLVEADGVDLCSAP